MSLGAFGGASKRTGRPPRDGIGDFSKGFVIVRMFRPHQPVPPCEIETEIIAGMSVVQVVMGDGRHPVEKRPAVSVGREELVPRMPDRVSQHHVRDKDQDRHWMCWQHKQDQRQVDRVRNRFAEIEAVRGKGRRVV